ncbi:hypothetical protein ASO20_02700 [Mycoplasma sp. (ex Biomphalaria glabrata)]|uniref:PolC-type DNA polymerase III n=1 Tax=Mycoplasma sp. (ex Biomphalaria glabrata) TaxID=1749074 RepID=UPI00073A8FA7|nr:PolC-type DNA polymerase III [Mycoplasma sp. (ex Biomphalaria glabrata)]ALV23544.1 hypothetical protein ASO20_02700 [Mycoplasma sp. (ex Biomphalaria glabrata)]
MSVLNELELNDDALVDLKKVKISAPIFDDIKRETLIYLGLVNLFPNFPNLYTLITKLKKYEFKQSYKTQIIIINKIHDKEKILNFVEQYFYAKFKILGSQWQYIERFNKILFFDENINIENITSELKKTFTFFSIKFEPILEIDTATINECKEIEIHRIQIIEETNKQTAIENHERKESEDILSIIESDKWIRFSDLLDGNKEKTKKFHIKGNYTQVNIRKGPKCFRFGFVIHDNREFINCCFYIQNEEAKKAQEIEKLFNNHNACQIVGKLGMKADWKTGKKEREISVIKINFINGTDLHFNIEIVDESPIKRTELHCHTKMSTMDGLISPDELLNTVSKWGWKSIAITDHSVVQSFPDVYSWKKKKKSDIKILYGCEFEVIDRQTFEIAKNENQLQNESVSIDEYIIFDLETTGLSPVYSEIIEFGAIHIKNNEIVSREQFFVKPKLSIPQHITAITNITNDDVKNAKPIEIELDRIRNYIKDLPLVAHNGFAFDSLFLKNVYEKHDLKFNNVIIDTMILARKFNNIFQLRRFRLMDLAKYFKVEYDAENKAHRADYDCEVLMGCFNGMISALKENGIELTELQKSSNNSDSFVHAKNYGEHVSILVKNQDGIRDLYQLVSEAHTKTFFDRPKLFWDEILQKRNNFLVGSSCLEGKIYHDAISLSDDDLFKSIQIFDYIEVLPPTACTKLIADGIFNSIEEIETLTKRIIKLAKKANKAIVATSNAHYISKEDKELRKIFVSTKGLGGVYHPLKSVLDKTQNIPDNHLRMTNEMIEEFSFLKDEKLINEIVIENPNKIVELVDNKIIPIKEGLYFAKIGDNTQKLVKEMVATATLQKYTHEGVVPKIVEDRIAKELNSIITYNFSDIYYIAHKIVNKSLQDNYLVGSRGSVGSSLVAHFMDITEVNPLPSHYLCPKCNFSDFNIDNEAYACGYDLPNKECPKCSTQMSGQGHNIPFETFLGFEGDKVPDIDLNFASSYQASAHDYTKELFGAENVLRAGTISTVAQKTAFSFVDDYDQIFDLNKPKAEKEILAEKCTGVRRTTGQHPGGIIVIPKDQNIFDFTPYNFPADDQKSEWKTTHFAYESLHDSLLKLDLLGHVDPEAIRMLQNITGVNPKDIPFNDPKVLSLFTSTTELKVDNIYAMNNKNGANGIPEFGTSFVKKMLEATNPKSFAELVRISGLSHGTDVWTNNAKDLVEKGIPLSSLICCRDDIMVYLLEKGLPPKTAFSIMEDVRKGKGLKPDAVDLLKKHNIEDWYIESCQKIKYMFPKAHATAYVIMGWRVAWFKIYYPLAYYATYFTLRCDYFDPLTMIKGLSTLKEEQQRIKDIPYKEKNQKTNHYYQHSN